MLRSSVALPRVQRPLLRVFGAYSAWYLRRHFHAVRVSGLVHARVPDHKPLIVVMNPPFVVDPLIALTLALRLFPGRTHYAPIDADALEKYRFFGRLGFFGVEREALSGASTFLRTGEAVLRAPRSALWVTAQGVFADPRQRPVSLKAGVSHLVRRVPGTVVLPVALEYPFWEERAPEALVRFGEPGADIQRALERTQDLLAADSIGRRRPEFEVLLSGAAGVGGVYDLWRSAIALARGRRFHRAHGSEQT